MSRHEVRTPTHDDMLHHWRLTAEVVSAAEALVEAEGLLGRPSLAVGLSGLSNYRDEAAVALIAAVGALRADRSRLGVCSPEETANLKGWAGKEKA